VSEADTPPNIPISRTLAASWGRDGSQIDNALRASGTGGNSGVRKATAAALAAAGHSVVIACRSLPKADRAAAEMGGDVEVRHLDLADLASVRRFADSVAAIDVLVNNAGVMGLPLTAPLRASKHISAPTTSVISR
jgi:NAD(P)-dependent dehydrogenase (short-subunit alcohol dehydrogenase family)